MRLSKDEYLNWKYKMYIKLCQINLTKRCDLTGEDEYHLCIRFRTLCLFKGKKFICKHLKNIERYINRVEAIVYHAK